MLVVTVYFFKRISYIQAMKHFAFCNAHLSFLFSIWCKQKQGFNTTASNCHRESIVIISPKEPYSCWSFFLKKLFSIFFLRDLAFIFSIFYVTKNIFNVLTRVPVIFATIVLLKYTEYSLIMEPGKPRSLQNSFYFGSSWNFETLVRILLRAIILVLQGAIFDDGTSSYLEQPFPARPP